MKGKTTAMKLGLSRRSFLKSSGIAVAALALADSKAHSFNENAETPLAGALSSKVATVCAMCRARCLVTASVKDGRLEKIEGNPINPFNGNMVCARGMAAVKLLYDPDRLKYPLKRVGARGEGKWKRISWDEALYTVASHIKKNLSLHGPESLALFAGGPSSYFIKTLFKESGIKNIYDAAAHDCQAIRDLAFQSTFGFGAGIPLRLDYSRSRCIVLIGSHLGENVQVPELRQVLSALQGGAELIVADPRFSSIAAKAGAYLPVKPGTDTALILGWLHHIISENLYDPQWVEENVSGFDELREHVQKYPVDKVAAITGISAPDIRSTAELMARHAPATIIHPGGHLNWYGNDVQRVRALAILTAILGAVGKDGSMQMPYDEWLPVEITDFIAGSRAEGPPFSSLLDDMLEQKIKVAGCWGQNPFQNHPAPYKTIEAFKKADFVFCCDVLPGEASLYADIVLPEATFLERLDILEVWADEVRPVVACRFPVLKPAFEAKDPYWIVKRIYDQIGRNYIFRHENIAAFLDSRLQKVGLALADIRQANGLKILERPILGIKRDDDGQDVDPFADYLPRPPRLQFPTASGRIEVYSADLAWQGWSPLPEYEEVPAPPAGYVRLLYGRSPVHTLTSTTNNPWLNHEMSENDLWLNEAYAARLGIRDGDRIFLENVDGIRSLKPIRVKVTAGIRPDCVYTVHGFGCRSPHLHEGFHRGISDTSLMTRSSRDPISNVRGMRVNFVRLVKVRG